MASIITEIFVSLDGEEFIKLDLHGDEAVNMKHTQKDLQDLSKIFSPYSQDFTFPATPKNRASFGFFGDTDAIKINEASKFPAKSYINGILNNTGFIQLSSLAYSLGSPSDFTGSFVTTMTNLKDRVGEDLLSELLEEETLIKWSAKEVQYAIKGIKSITSGGVLLKYFVPLISTNRVWGYDQFNGSEILDNVAYNSTSDLNGNNIIRPEELRPAIFYSSVIELIKKKYGLNIEQPLEERPEYTDLVVWCNAERLASFQFKTLPILKSFGGLGFYDYQHENRIEDPKKYTIIADILNDTFKVTKRASPFTGEGEYIERAFNFTVKFDGVEVTGNAENPEVNIRYLRASDDAVLKTGSFELTGSSFVCTTLIEDDLFAGANDLEFYIQAEFQQPTSWTVCEYRIFFRYYDEKSGTFSQTNAATYFYDSLSNNNSSIVSTDNIDLVRSLPKTKVADFLTSHFKAFNMSVFNTDPTTDKLYWLTPEDIKSTGKVYSKSVLDYTPYVDNKNFSKDKPNDFNYYNFKHADSDYFSNKKYLEAGGLAYGQTVYPETKPKDLKEFKIETHFNIIPPVIISGAPTVVTAYGFTDEPPEIIETGEARYTANYDALTVFYSHGSTDCVKIGLLGTRLFNLGITGIVEIKGVHALNSYIKVMPWDKNGRSFGFSVLSRDGTSYTNSLYFRYYAEQTARLLNPNVLSQKFSLILPAKEIYLNKSTATQGQGSAPEGFRLQNDIIIGENLFTIVDATIDQTTGKTKMTLLNY